MKILITGGFGFIGSSLGKYLLLQKHEIVLASRNSNRDVSSWLPQAKIVKIRWNDFDLLKKICDNVDVIIHSAGMNASESKRNPNKALEVNGLNTKNLISAAVKEKVKKFIYFSTAHVYGSPLRDNIDEKSKLTNLHPYATTHLAGEKAVQYINQTEKTQGIVIRLSNCYGVPVHNDVDCWMLLVNDLCKQAVLTDELILKTNGKQQRDFIPISTLCKIISDLILLNEKNTDDGIYNIGSGKSINVEEMAIKIKLRSKIIMKKNIKIFKGNKYEEESIFQYNINKLLNAGINFNVEHDKEIDRLINYCKERFRN